MKWKLASEEKPKFTDEVTWRIIATKTALDKRKIYDCYEDGLLYHDSVIKFEGLEWLDEDQSPSPAPVPNKSAEEILNSHAPGWLKKLPPEAKQDFIDAMEEYSKQSAAVAPVDVKSAELYAYFIERKDTNEWYRFNFTGYYGSTYHGEPFGVWPDPKNDWTRNPLEAFSFTSKQQAEELLKSCEFINNISVNELEVTEHLFVSYEKSCKCKEGECCNKCSTSAYRSLPASDEGKEGVREDAEFYNSIGNYKITKGYIGQQVTFDIDGKDLIYADAGTHEGLQCKHMGESKAYNRIFELCKKINNCIKEIDKLND